MRLRGKTWDVTLAAVGAVLLAAGGYEAGVRTHGSAAPSCAASRHAAEGLVDEWTKQELHADDAQRLLKARAVADAVLQNPRCFTPEVDARAQAAAQQLGQSGITDDVRRNAGEFGCEALGRSPYDCQA